MRAGRQTLTDPVTRYGDREVPFPEALDEEVGVGAAVPGALALEPTPLLHGLGLRAKGGGAASKWSRRDQMLLAKLEEAWSARATSITLTDADLAPLAKAKKDPLPASLAAMVTLLGGTGGRIAMNGWSGASAARLLGRFAAWSPELATALRAHLKDEEGTAPDAVFAEIVHLPDGSRAANILLRPLLREHEIAFCGRSGADPSKTLAVSDLTLSVRRRRVRLFSRTLGREIVPRLSSAHNTATRQLAAYRLLAALQGQGVTSGAAFDWGVLGGAKVLPRVVYGNTILSPQRWRLDEAEVRALSQPTAIGRYRAVAALRARLALPRYVGLQEGDNILPTDLDSSLSVDALVGALKGEKGARLIELDLDAGGADGACRGPDGTYANELVVPFLHGVPKTATAATQPGASAATGPALRRSFAPGSEWCVAKVYCPSGAADAVLRECVAPLVASAIGSGAADGWFFTRDADPDVHLRVHLHGVPARLYGEVLPELEAVLRPLLDAGRARRLVVAPYERAIERDGGDHAVPLLERIHHADSDAALALLRLLEDVPEGKERWAFALLGMHRILGDFEYVPDARRRVLEAGQRQLEADLALTVEQQRAIADRYRQERPFFAGWLEGRDVPEAVEAAFAARSAAVRPLARALAARKAEGKLVGRFDTLVSNAMNAWVRRMMRARSTHHAAVLHAFLAKHYESVAARSKKAASKP